MGRVKLMTDDERMRGKYLVDAATGCWCWSGSLDRDGYAAQFRIGSRSDESRRNVKPHRWTFERKNGPIAEGLVIDHLCRNRACVNPDHMEAVTPLVNHARGLRAKRAICPKGHAIAGANELQRRSGIRCRICANAYAREYQRRTGFKHSNAYRLRKRRASSVTATN